MPRLPRTALLAALAFAGAACRPDVPILTWHSVGPAGDEYTVGEAAFAAQLDALRNAGFHAVTFHEWLEHQDRGAPLPDKPVLFTFDDGYQDALTAALPALRARGMRATPGPKCAPSRRREWRSARTARRTGASRSSPGRKRYKN